jgi:chorismate mutase
VTEDQAVPVIAVPNGLLDQDNESVSEVSESRVKDKKQIRSVGDEDKVTPNKKGSSPAKKKKAAVSGAKSARKRPSSKSTSAKPPPPQPDMSCTLTLSDMTPEEIHVIKAIGKIKRQKQRASFDRLSNILKTLRNEFPAFESNDSVAEVLQSCLNRGLLQETRTDNNVLSYKEMGPGIAIVAQIARRKNAASLAATYNMDISSLPDLDEPLVVPVKPASTPRQRASRAKKKKAPAPAAEPTAESENHVESILDAVIAAEDPVLEAVVPKVCGLCREDGSDNNTLITCSACGLSGK